MDDIESERSTRIPGTIALIAVGAVLFAVIPDPWDLAVLGVLAAVQAVRDPATRWYLGSTAIAMVAVAAVVFVLA